MEVLYIVMPVYNEEDIIEEVIRSWAKNLRNKSPDSRIVVADSGSVDSTHSIICSLMKEFNQLVLIETSRKEHGFKLIELYEYAIDQGADYIFQTDSDGQTNPDEFESFWNLRDEYDAIIGNRKRRGDGKCRFIIEKVLCVIIRMIFGVSVPDANAPFRLMKKDVLNKYIRMMSNVHDIPNVMMTTLFMYYGENIIYKYVSFGARKGGNNSLNILGIARIGLRNIRSFLKLRHKLLKWSVSKEAGV